MPAQHTRSMVDALQDGDPFSTGDVQLPDWRQRAFALWPTGIKPGEARVADDQTAPGDHVDHSFPSLPSARAPPPPGKLHLYGTRCAFHSGASARRNVSGWLKGVVAVAVPDSRPTTSRDHLAAAALPQRRAREPAQHADARSVRSAGRVQGSLLETAWAGLATGGRTGREGRSMEVFMG